MLGVQWRRGRRGLYNFYVSCLKCSMALFVLPEVNVQSIVCVLLEV